MDDTEWSPKVDVDRRISRKPEAAGRRISTSAGQRIEPDLEFDLAALVALELPANPRGRRQGVGSLRLTRLPARDLPIRRRRPARCPRGSGIPLSNELVGR